MAIIALSADQCQYMVNYIIADLTNKANVCTERSEIEALRVEAEKCGITTIDFDAIWEETQKEAISTMSIHFNNINKFFGI